MKTIQELANQIEEQNEIFENASKEEKIVMIAQDTIDRISAKCIRPVKGNLLIFYDDSDGKESESFKDLVNTGFRCNTCAKGGLFVSYVGRANKMLVEDVDISANDHSNSSMQKLLEIFTERQLALIEYAYEFHQYIDHDLQGEEIEFDESTQERIEDFYFRYSENDDRLIAICENIIKNEGVFIV